MGQVEENGHELMLSSLEDWERMLRLYSKTTGMISSLYLPSGKRLLGPYSGSDFGTYLIDAGGFEVGQVLQKQEAMYAVRTNVEKENISFYFQDALAVRALRIELQNKLQGVIVYGWVFDHFPDPVECYNLSKILNQAESTFWQAARIQAPTSKEKFLTYEAMLDLLCSTLMVQLLHLHIAKRNARLKDELLASVSHELKTPLTAIILRLQMLKRHKDLSPFVQDVAERLETSAQTQSKLIEDLLDSAKVITGKFNITISKIDLKDVLINAIKSVSALAEKKKISVEKTGLDEEFPFEGDSSRLQQVFNNILTNAIKFTDDGGEIKVDLTKNISSYVIRFTDNGSGIEPAFMPLLFEKFAQHESKIGQANSGLGLGLALAKTIVELHHGTIEADSAGKGKGSVFEIKLPRSKDSEKQSS